MTSPVDGVHTAPGVRISGGDLLVRLGADERLEVESGGLTAAGMAAQTAPGFLARHKFGQRRQETSGVLNHEASRAHSVISYCDGCDPDREH